MRKAAEAEPETVSALLEKEISNGWVVRTDMSVEQARQHWHKGIAVGKLNVVRAVGKEPRLVLDSTVCGVNPKCNILERVSLPTPSDVRLAFMPGDTHASFIGASFDFKAAHKQIQVHPRERGLLLFRFADTLYHCSVPLRSPVLRVLVGTHWSILTQAATRGVISAPLFVDLLAALRHQQLALIVIFFAAVSAPISWKKVQFQNCLTWCGWSINFLLETIELTPLKTLKLKEQLRALLRSKRIKRKLLEQVLGLLIWATSLSLELRSWLAPLYADLHSPPGCMISINARLCPAFLSALNAKARLAWPVHGIFMPLGSKVLEYKQTPVRSPSNLPSVVPSHKAAWVHVADPAAKHTRLSKASRANIEWQIWHARCRAGQSWHAKQQQTYVPRAPQWA